MYSPGYSNPDKSIFHEFSRELAKKFKAEIVPLPEIEEDVTGPSKIRSLAKAILPKQAVAMKRSLVSRMHQLAYAKDVEFYQHGSTGS